MDIHARLTELARITAAPAPVVSVYLTTRWSDEHQRDRVRVFLKNELRQTRRRGGRALEADLDWIETQAGALVDQARFPDAHGVALFACQALGLREILPLRAPLEDAFVVADTPFLRPLAALVDAAPATVVVFVDSESARLIPLGAEGAGETVTLESDVPGRHRQGGWALLAQSRYQRHIAEHRGRHFEAVAGALVDLTEGSGARRILLVGEPRTLAEFRRHLPGPTAARIVGSVPGARHEPDSALVGRAAELLASQERRDDTAVVDSVLTEAAKGGRAVAGLEETLDAVNRGAVQRLFLLEGCAEPGRACPACGALQPGSGAPCRLCGQTTRAVELGEAVVDRVIAAGGTVEVVGDHAGLARVGGVAARLRYAL